MLHTNAKAATPRETGAANTNDKVNTIPHHRSPQQHFEALSIGLHILIVTILILAGVCR